MVSIPDVKLPNMDDREIKDVIKNQNLCRIAFIDGKYPYIAPFQYLYYQDQFYFHFTDYGKKKEILNKNNHVCISIEQLEPDLRSYSFITFQGKLSLVKNNDLKNRVIKELIKEARENFSEEFLAAHGFEKENGWDSFQIENQLIYTLHEISYKIGLKST